MNTGMVGLALLQKSYVALRGREYKDTPIGGNVRLFDHVSYRLRCDTFQARHVADFVDRPDVCGKEWIRRKRFVRNESDTCLAC